MTEQSYVPRRLKLLKSFDRSVAHGRRALDRHFGDKLATSIVEQSRCEYEAIIPQIPYIGDRSPFLLFLLPTSRYLAFYRVLLRQGVTVEEAGRLIYRMNESEIGNYPDSLSPHNRVPLVFTLVPRASEKTSVGVSEA